MNSYRLGHSTFTYTIQYQFRPISSFFFPSTRNSRCYLNSIYSLYLVVIYYLLFWIRWLSCKQFIFPHSSDYRWRGPFNQTSHSNHPPSFVLLRSTFEIGSRRSRLLSPLPPSLRRRLSHAIFLETFTSSSLVPAGCALSSAGKRKLKTAETGFQTYDLLQDLRR